MSGNPTNPGAPESADIPEPAVTRLATYLHVLRSFSRSGILVASSGQLATAAGVNPSILRKDLSHVGANGVRGVGYDVGRLTARISLALHTDGVRTVALAGAGCLGRTLLEHVSFGRGFLVVTMFDSDPTLAGTRLDSDGPVIEPLSRIREVCANPAVGPVDIGVIATEGPVAQATCDAFIDAGVRQLLNVTQTSLRTDAGVFVRQVDLALELQVLAFNASRSRVAPDPAGSATDARTTKREPAMGPTMVSNG